MIGEPIIPDYYRAAIEKIKKEVESKDDKYILGVNLNEYIEYIYDDYALPAIEIDEPRKQTIRKIKKTKEVGDYSGESFKKEIVEAKITIYFNPKHNIEWSLKLRPSSGYHTHKFPVSIDGDTLTLETLANDQDINHELKMLFEEVGNKNKEIEPQNQQLKKQVEQIVQQRYERIRDEEDRFEALINKVSIPLVRKEGIVIPDITKLEIANEYRTLVPPTATKITEPSLDKEKVNAVIGLIEGCCRSWELSPQTYSDFEEDKLRDIILSSLNSVFRGSATSETFSKKGRTDIYLNIPQGQILIAECKIWDGAKKFHETVDQILNYLTWRNSYGMVINFSRNKGFTSVLETLFAEIPKHGQYRKGLNELEMTHFVSYNSLLEDERKLVELHYLSYNLFA